MLGFYAKAGVFAVALAVLVVEAYLVYGYYDRHHWRTVDPDAGSGALALRESASRPTGASGASTGRDVASERTSEDHPADPESVTYFEHRATDLNSRGDYTYVERPYFDGDPDAVVIAAPSPDQKGAGDGAYGHNIGVWYDFADKKRWAVFNQDRAPVPSGATFEIAVPLASQMFVHRAGPSNTAGSSTYLDDPLVNGKPSVNVSVTQNWNPGGGIGVYNDHPVGVRYDAGRERWTVFNKDGARIPNRAAFNVVVSAG